MKKPKCTFYANYYVNKQDGPFKIEICNDQSVFSEKRCMKDDVCVKCDVAKYKTAKVK